MNAMVAEKNFLTQVAIVTGAGQGIGFEICRLLALGGAAVILNDIDDALFKRVIGDLLAYLIFDDIFPDTSEASSLEPGVAAAEELQHLCWELSR